MDKEEKENILFFRIAIPVILLVVLLGVYFNFEIKRNAVFTTGKILSYSYATGKSSGTFQYEYVYMNKLIKSNQTIGGVHSYRKFFEKSFPVAVSSFTGRSEILVTPYHFKRFNISFPDSLNWVKEFIRN